MTELETINKTYDMWKWITDHLVIPNIRNDYYIQVEKLKGQYCEDNELDILMDCFLCEESSKNHQAEQEICDICLIVKYKIGEGCDEPYNYSNDPIGFFQNIITPLKLIIVENG